MPHSSVAHQKALRSVGGYVGGVGGVSPTRRRGLPPDRLEDPQNNQTRIGGDGMAYYPEPQSLLTMPYQNAGYDDNYNVAGRRASTENIAGWSGYAKDFLLKHDTVYINPAYELDYLTQPSSMDTRERHMQRLAPVRAGLEQFAEANSAYFDKKFVVLKKPLGRRKLIAAKNPDRTLQLNINETRRRGIAGSYFRGWGMTEPRYFTPNSPYLDSFTLNTTGQPGAMRYFQDPKYVANTAQHEFGHLLGLQHPPDDDIYTSYNTTMSYSSLTGELGARLGPSDINYYKNLQKKLGMAAPQNYRKMSFDLPPRATTRKRSGGRLPKR